MSVIIGKSLQQEDRPLQWYGAGLCMAEFITGFYVWYYDFMSVIAIDSAVVETQQQQQLPPPPLVLCWPFWQSCGEDRRRHPLLIMFGSKHFLQAWVATFMLLSVMGAALYVLPGRQRGKGGRSVGWAYLCHWTACLMKVAFVLLDYRLFDNAHIVMVWSTMAFLFVLPTAPAKRDGTRVLLTLYYVWAGSHKIKDAAWWNGTVLLDSIPLFSSSFVIPEALLRCISRYVMVLELIWSWGLLAYDVTWMQYTVTQFMIYHIISIVYMGWFYPTLMLLLLTAVPLFAYDEYQTPLRPRDNDHNTPTTLESSLSNSATTTSSQQRQQPSLDRSLLSRFLDNQSFYSVYLVAAVFSFLQTIPHRFPVNDLILSGEGRLFGILHHVQPITVECTNPSPFWLRTFKTGHSVPLLNMDDNDNVLLSWPGGNSHIYNHLQCDPWVVMQMAHYWCHYHPVLAAAAAAEAEAAADKTATATTTPVRTTRTSVLDVYLFARKRKQSSNHPTTMSETPPAPAVTAVVYEEDVCHHFYWRHETFNIPDSALERSRGNILVYEWWKHNGWILSPRHKYKRPPKIPTTTTTTTPLQPQQ